MCKLTVWLEEKYFGKKIKIGFYVEEKKIKWKFKSIGSYISMVHQIEFLFFLCYKCVVQTPIGRSAWFIWSIIRCKRCTYTGRRSHTIDIMPFNRLRHRIRKCKCHASYHCYETRGSIVAVELLFVPKLFDVFSPHLKELLLSEFIENTKNILAFLRL